MTLTKKEFGRLASGEPVWLYELANSHGMRVEVLSYGALIKSIHVHDSTNQVRNVVLGYADLPSYLADTAYLGATIGRYCNRIENACFRLNGKMLEVVANVGANQLHGGRNGFNRRLWSHHEVADGEQSTLVLAYHSVAGEQGFPGNLQARVTYRLTEENQLVIEFTANTDATTVVNLTNHSYFNLHGDPDRTVLDHEVIIDADHYLPMKASFVPTGAVVAVDNTPFDLRMPIAIEKALIASNEQLQLASGFDHNWVLNSQADSLREVASARSAMTGIKLSVATTQPGLQFYTGNSLESAGFQKHAALCFETQHFPNSPNQVNFPTTILQPGETYSQTTVYALGSDNA